MARHGKKPSEENTSSRAPRTIAGSTTPNTSADSADGIDAATSSSAADTNAIDTNATGTRTIVSGDTSETSDQQSLEADGSVKSNESRQPQDPFDEVIAQGISDGDAWTNQHVKRFYRQSLSP